MSPRDKFLVAGLVGIVLGVLIVSATIPSAANNGSAQDDLGCSRVTERHGTSEIIYSVGCDEDKLDEYIADHALEGERNKLEWELKRTRKELDRLQDCLRFDSC